MRMGDEEKAATVIRTLYTLKDFRKLAPTSPVAAVSDGGGAYRQGDESIAMEVLRSTATERSRDNNAADELEVVMSKV